MTRRLIPAVAVLLTVLPPAAGGQDQAQTAVREGVARRIYISATDDKGAPATDLTPQEITVREDGKQRDVLQVGPATETMQIALLVDDSGAGIQYIREGAASFVRILQNRAEIAIVSTAGQNSVVVDFTSDIGALMNGVNRLITRTTSGGYLLDGIQESARTLQRREAARPVIVVLALEGKEFSNVSTDRVLDVIRRSGAVVHVLAVGKPTLKTMTGWNQRPTDSIHEALDETLTRGAVMIEAPRRSGGRLEQIVQATGIPTRFAEIAYDLRDQLVVTYARPQSAKDVKSIDVSVKRRGIKLRAPKHVS
jgi:VWFA-related protein